MELRSWQKRAYDRFYAKNQRIFVLEATPGAGKTVFCLFTADQYLGADAVDGIIVVSPTDHLRTQWANKAAEFNLDIDPTWRADKGPYYTSDYWGISITYAQLASEVTAQMVARLCRQQRMFVILDEPHHMSSVTAWGDGAKLAFDEDAERLLLVTGTLFRSDMNPIPFIDYREGMRQDPDFQYSYGDALRDGYCRPVFFPSYSGDMEWLSYSGELMKANFDQELSERQDRERLNTALSVTGNWIPQVLEQANNTLIDIRESIQSDAGGLVVAYNQQHARDIADILERITGSRPVLAMSDIPEASDEISNFARGRKPWIVAVKMVSEGVDIPRLRVGVFATNVTTELFFRQVVGRVVRMQDLSTDQSAYMYIPEQPEYIEYARRMKQIVEHYIEDISQDVSAYDEELKDIDELEERLVQSPFVPISSEAEHARTLNLHTEISPEEIEIANRLRAQYGWQDTPEKIASILRAGQSANLQSSYPTSTTATPSIPKFKRIQSLSSASTKAVSKLGSKYKHVIGNDANPYKTINFWWNKKTDKTAHHMTEEDYRKKLEWLASLDSESEIIRLRNAYGVR